MRFSHRIALIATALTSIALPAAIAAQGFGDPRPRLPAGPGGYAAGALVDLDGDGRLDIVRAEDSRLAVWLQDASGNFAAPAGQQPLDFGSAGRVLCVAVGRFDGDARPDLFVGLSGGTDAILLNAGAGRLRRATPDPLPPSQGRLTRGASAADLDGDGRDDLLLHVAAAGVRLLLQGGNGVFVDGTARLPVVALANRDAVVAADVTADGAIDLVLGAGAAAPAVLLRNDGSGDFRLNVTRLPVVAGGTSALAVGDVSGDGLPDLGFAPDSGGSVEVLLADGLGGFVVASGAGFPSDGFRDLEFADVDGDRRADAIAVTGIGELRVAAALGGGAFGPSRPLVAGDPLVELLVGDLEPDGDPDLWAPGASGADRLLIGGANGDFVDSEIATIPRGAVTASYALAVVDFTGEGDPDLLRIDRDGDVAAFVQDGGARFRAVANAPLPALPGGGAWSDLAVGRLRVAPVPRDLFLLGQQSATNAIALRLLSWQGGSYSDVSASVLGSLPTSAPTALRVGSFRQRAGREDPSDVVVGDAAGQMFFLTMAAGVLRNVPGAFTPVTSGAVLQVLAGNFDGDGIVDFVALHSAGPPALHIARPMSITPAFDHDGRATATVPQAVAGAVLDLDRDGRDDLVLATPSRTEGLTVLLARNGVFVDATPVWMANVGSVTGVEAIEPVRLANASGVAIGGGSGLLAVLSVGATAFARITPVAIHGVAPVRALHAADLDGDGDDDLVVTRRGREPAVLLDGRLALFQRGIAQDNRPLRLAFGAPPNSLAALLFSPLTARVPVPGIGTLRLLSPATLAAWPVPLSGGFVQDLPLPVGLGPIDIPLQLAILDFATARASLGNLEIAHVTDR